MSIWTETRLALLLDSFKMGHSRNQTAAYVSQHGGVTVSRSACIGKLARMGYSDTDVGVKNSRQSQRLKLEAKRKRDQSQAAPKKPRTNAWSWDKPTVSPRRATPVPGAGRPAEVLPLPPDDPLPDHKLKALVDLEHGECRWPYGEPGAPGFGFCGQPQFPGMPYCDGHCRRAYAPPVLPLSRRLGAAQPGAGPLTRAASTPQKQEA